MTEPTGGIEIPMTEEELANAVPIEETPEEAVTETVSLEADGSVETIERDGGTAVSAAYRTLTGLDDQPE